MRWLIKASSGRRRQDSAIVKTEKEREKKREKKRDRIEVKQVQKAHKGALTQRL